MGQYLEGINSIPAGNIFAIGNLDNIVYKTATLSTLYECPSFAPMNLGAVNLLKVSITASLDDYPKLVNGLKKLNKSDPSVNVYAQENGDIILSTCGEVHLEKCIIDIEELFSKVKVKVSEPIVSFRETVSYENIKEINNKKQIQENMLKEQQELKEEQQQKEEEKKEEKVYDKDAEIVDVYKQQQEEWDPDEKRIIEKEKERKLKYQYKEQLKKASQGDKNKAKLFCLKKIIQ